MKQIRLLEIQMNRDVDEIVGGAYRSVFKGHGIEFDEVREYTDDDDVRDIDWNVTARMGSPYVKRYSEERELNVMLLVDVSASGFYGSGEVTKRQTAAELAALLAFSAGSNGDKVGLLLFSDRRELLLPPRSGRTHTLRLIREMLAFVPNGRGTDIALALRDARSLLVKRSVVFLISDFVDAKGFEDILTVTNRHHDVVAVRIRDRAEQHWPVFVPISVQDSENGRTLSVVLNRSAAAKVCEAARDAMEEIDKICRRAKVDVIDIQCGEAPLGPLIRFFSQRRRRLRR